MDLQASLHAEGLAEARYPKLSTAILQPQRALKEVLTSIVHCRPAAFPEARSDLAPGRDAAERNGFKWKGWAIDKALKPIFLEQVLLMQGQYIKLLHNIRHST